MDVDEEEKEAAGVAGGGMVYGHGRGEFRTVVEDLFGLGTSPSVVFLDGPRHGEELDLNACYEYFCTSGGHPLPKNAQNNMFLWILDGWNEAETIDAFKSFGRTGEEVIEAYSICGGCMRDMVRYVDGDEMGRSSRKCAFR
eukprot:scaffold36536_cov229-Amphora_coffeaeformis.AAC.1